MEVRERYELDRDLAALHDRVIALEAQIMEMQKTKADKLELEITRLDLTSLAAPGLAACQ